MYWGRGTTARTAFSIWRLSAAVYGASEGLRTIVVERDTTGGQAGTSSLIRNYRGFPFGISGAELTNRARSGLVVRGRNLSGA
ncbi:MAG: hypothetical protein IT324_02340 [Anaerolineae bacterium]|nr:hypothetical protein [Anaerolineae bacterium]